MTATTFVPQSIYVTSAGLVGANAAGLCQVLSAEDVKQLAGLSTTDSPTFASLITTENITAGGDLACNKVTVHAPPLLTVGTPYITVPANTNRGLYVEGTSDSTAIHVNQSGVSRTGTTAGLCIDASSTTPLIVGRDTAAVTQFKVSNTGGVDCSSIATTGNIVTPGTGVAFANTGLRAGGIAIGRGASGVAGEQINVWNNGVNKLSLVSSQGLNLANDRRIRLSSTTSSPGTMDASIGRASTGMVDILADNGLVVRNLTNTADATITAGFVISPTVQYGSGNQRIKGSPNAVTVRNSIDNANGTLEALMLIGDGNVGYAISTSHGLVAANNKLIGFSNSVSGQGARDTIATRNASGPKWTLQSDGGVEIRNLANTADTPITCGALNPNGDLTFATTNPVIRAGSTVLIDNSVFFNSATHAASRAAAINGFIVGSIYSFKFSSTTGANGVADTALSRQSAGVIEVNNGTSGQLRDMAMRAIGLWSSTPPASQPAAIPDATDLASALTSLNSLLAATRSYGLISS